MEIIDNTNRLRGDDLKKTLVPGAKLKVAASCFSIYAYEALKAELERIDSLQFIFTAPTFVPGDAADKVRKERREFYIPKRERERSLYGSEFEIRLRNELTQRAIAKECADWMRRRATFRSNRGSAPMQQFACVTAPAAEAVYTPLQGFTAVDLGYQPGNAVSNFVHKVVEPPFTATYWLSRELEARRGLRSSGRKSWPRTGHFVTSTKNGHPVLHRTLTFVRPCGQCVPRSSSGSPSGPTSPRSSAPCTRWRSPDPPRFRLASGRRNS